MTVQVNKWLPDEYRFESYEEATRVEGARIRQIDPSHNHGLCFQIKRGEDTIRELEGGRISYYGGQVQVNGYVEDTVERSDAGLSHYDWGTGNLHRELWIEIKDGKG